VDNHQSASRTVGAKHKITFLASTGADRVQQVTDDDDKSLEPIILPASVYIILRFCYTLCSEKNPLLFSFITSSQINQFAQKFQHL